MALETLVGVTKIGDANVLQDRPKDANGAIDWHAFDELRKTHPIYVDHVVNMISFRIQNGPINEVGVNGCQVDELIEAAKMIIAKLNDRYPCTENEKCIGALDIALSWLKLRKLNRLKRGVEGFNKE